MRRHQDAIEHGRLIDLENIDGLTGITPNLRMSRVAKATHQK